jgi:hypothetical protein
MSVQVGTIMAASDRFNITVLGRGGHAGLPHKARDPVVAAAALDGALQVCGCTTACCIFQTKFHLPSEGIRSMVLNPHLWVNARGMVDTGQSVCRTTPHNLEAAAEAWPLGCGGQDGGKLTPSSSGT